MAKTKNLDKMVFKDQDIIVFETEFERESILQYFDFNFDIVIQAIANYDNSGHIVVRERLKRKDTDVTHFYLAVPRKLDPANFLYNDDCYSFNGMMKKVNVENVKE